MTNKEAIFELIKYRRRLEEDPTIIFARGLFDAEPFDMAIEALERQHGRWIKDRLCSTSGGTYGVRRCSICEHYFQDLVNEYNFCPNCGSDMRGEENDKG